ncbi:MAG: hypothetical protein IJB59_09195 [Oscillospiraceae bacterium]|nr:hypothetical protein [Oscillospiraceae bacterium]
MRWMIVLVLMAALLYGCGKPDAVITGEETAQPQGIRDDNTISAEEPLAATVESREEAEELARLYGITLVDYSYGVATFDTREDPQAVIARGREQGWPELSLNGNIKAY